MLHPHYKSNQVWHTSAQIRSAVQAHVLVPPLVKSFLYHIVIPCCKKSDKMSNLKNQKKIANFIECTRFYCKKILPEMLKAIFIGLFTLTFASFEALWAAKMHSISIEIYVTISTITSVLPSAVRPPHFTVFHVRSSRCLISFRISRCSRDS